MFRMRIVAVTLGALPLSACNVGPDFQPPASGLPSIPFANPASATSSKEATASAESSRPPDPTWWKAFRDPTLTSLEQRVATANLDVRTATLRIAESRFQRGVVAAAELPSINGSGKYQRELYSQNGIASLLGQLIPGGSGRRRRLRRSTNIRPGSTPHGSSISGAASVVRSRRPTRRPRRPRSKGATRWFPSSRRLRETISNCAARRPC